MNYGLTGREIQAILGGDYEIDPAEFADDDDASLPVVSPPSPHADDCACEGCTFPW